MIDFELTEDHKALVQTVREFAQKEVAPYIKEWDEKQEFHPEVLKKMGELNLLGVCIPEAVRRRRFRLHFARPGLRGARGSRYVYARCDVGAHRA